MTINIRSYRIEKEKIRLWNMYVGREEKIVLPYLGWVLELLDFFNRI